MQHRFTFTLALLAACAGAHAEFRADYEATEQAAGAQSLSRLQLSGDHARIDDGGSSVVLDAGSGRITRLLHSRRRFVDLRKGGTKAGKELTTLSPEQRTAFAEATGAKTAPAPADSAPHTAATGTKETVRGHNCEIYRTDAHGHHVQDTCLAGVDEVGVPVADRVALQHLFEELTALAEQPGTAALRSPLAGIPAGKFPVRITRYAPNGKVLQVIELKSLSGGGVNAGDFAIPAGYKEEVPPSPPSLH